MIRTDPGLYILDGKTAVPCEDLFTWADWLETHGRDRMVARTTIGDAEVSTVFLALDHSFHDDAPPLLFETMVFGGPHDGDQYRYSTWAEAEAGHARVVAELRGPEA